MTARRGKPVETLRYEKTGDGGDGPSFNSAWRWMMNIVSGVMVALMIAAMTWLWNTQTSLTTLSLAVGNNADAIKSLTTALERLQQSDAQQAATLATVQVQISNQQTNASAANITLSSRLERMESTLGNRIDNMEKEARWRDRFQQQPATKGGR